MNTRAARWLGLALYLAVWAATPAAGDDRTAIRTLVRSFVEAAKKGDSKAMDALLAKRALDSGSVDSSAMPPDPDMTYRTSEPVLNAAVVSVKVDSRSAKDGGNTSMQMDAALVLRQEVGQWRVCGGGIGEVETLEGSASPQAAAVKTAALAFLKATESPGGKAAQPYLTARARQCQQGRLNDLGFGDAGATTTYKLGTPTLNLAVVPFYAVTKGEEMPVLLVMVREMNQWKILSLILGESMEEPSKDKGKPKSSVAQGAMSLEQFMGGAATPEPKKAPLEAVTVAAYEAGWKPGFAAAGQSASQLLPKLAKALGLQMDVPRDPAFGKAVTVDFTGRSSLECIEAVCSEVGYNPTYARGIAALRKGTRPRPAVFAGPFMVELEEVTQDLATASGALKYRVYAAGLLPAVRESMELNSYALEPLTGTRGEDISAHGGGPCFGLMSGDEQTPSTFLAHDGAALRNLLRPVTGVKGPHMKFTVRVPTRVDVLRFNRIATGEVQRAGSVTATLKEVRGDGRSVSVLMTGTAGGSGVQVAALDAAGKPIEEVSHGGFGGGDSYEAELGCEARIVTLTVRVPAFQEVTYDAQFPDIPIKPGLLDKLPAVTFAGHAAPATVQFVAITGEPDFRKVKVRITNHANKPLRLVRFKLEHLGAAGKLVGEEKSDRWSADAGSALARGASAESEVIDFFMPAETKTVRLTLETVEFADGASWPEPVSGKPSVPAGASAAPADLRAFADKIGQQMVFVVTGSIYGMVWGTDFYTLDSALAVAAVHAGALAAGETGKIKVTLVAGRPSYKGSARNGVTSSDWGSYDGSYRVEKVRQVGPTKPSPFGGGSLPPAAAASDEPAKPAAGTAPKPATPPTTAVRPQPAAESAKHSAVSSWKRTDELR